MLFKDIIFSLLGPNEKRIDSHKDAQGRGVFERYMMSYGDDIDTNIVPLIENLNQNTLDVEKLWARYLDYHEQTRGVLPLSFTRGTTDANAQLLNRWTRRRILRHIEKLRAVRGTRKGYELLIRLVDRTVQTVGITEVFFENRYDETRFDDNKPFDTSICGQCAQYSISIVSDGSAMPPSLLLVSIRSIILFNQPIDTHLSKVTYNGYDIDTVSNSIIQGLEDFESLLWDAEGQLFDAETG